MSKVYENKVQIIECEYNEVPELKEELLKMENNLGGCRIGFDAGGSDRKVSALIDGEVVFRPSNIYFITTNYP